MPSTAVSTASDSVHMNPRYDLHLARVRNCYFYFHKS